MEQDNVHNAGISSKTNFSQPSEVIDQINMVTWDAVTLKSWHRDFFGAILISEK